MAIVRMLEITIDPAQAETVKKNWAEICAPIMREVFGCRSESLLHRKDAPGQFLSYSVWDSMADIENYAASDAFTKIKEANAGLGASKVSVKHFSLAD